MGVPGPSRSNSFVALDEPHHVSYTSIIHYMVIFLPFLRYWTFFATKYYPGGILGVPGPSRSIFFVVLDGPRRVFYTSIIHYMVIFFTVFEILDIFHDEILP